jgi:uncharacterized protein YyaL (SSP411 family)
VFNEPAWIAAAARAYDFVCSMTTNGLLYHAACGGTLKGLGMLDDYAQMARAALKLLEATQEQRYLADAENFVATLDAKFWDSASGGYFFTSVDANDLIVRTRTASDNATPAGNGVIVGVLAHLYALTGNDAYQKRARAIVSAFSGEIKQNFFSLATLLNSIETLENLTRVVIVGTMGAPDVKALLSAVYTVCIPGRLVSVIAPNQNLPAHHPAAGKREQGKRAAAYVCRGSVCADPVSDSDQLRDILMRKYI